MLKVGLTGGIACGKSVIRARFESRGVVTLDADSVVHDLFQSDDELVGELSRCFGADVLSSDGGVNRKALGAIVFDDPSKRVELESIVHPRVFAAIRSFLRTASTSEALAVVDAALMIETGSYELYDRIVVASCSRELQRERLMARDGLTAEQADNRIAAQMPLEEKRLLADHIIDTSGTLEQTLERADDVLAALQREAKERGSTVE